MKDRFLYSVVGLAALVSMAQAQTAQQAAPRTTQAKSKTAAQRWTAPRAPDGHPDLQGYWANNNATPLERPKELAGRATLTDEELAAMKKKAHELFGGKSDAAFGDTVFLATLANVQGAKAGFKSVDGETGDYSSVWTVERDWDNRTSLITDPPDGRIPAMTPDALKRRQTALAAAQHPPAGPEDRSLSERCITFGSPQLTEGYQSQYQIVQTPGSVAVMTEMIHDTRIVSLDGRPHPPAAVEQWLGDSRGHWEGDTLVVDSTNYKPRAFMSVSSEKLHVTERFSLSGPETLKYEITIDDPDTWTKPWSLMIPLRRSPPVYEYACHEGNEGLAGILAGARAAEAAAKQK
ncbi:MAG TPA: hypothetical protein VHY84_24745 [Bryobacteraceae bacterium]|jgi:hypothetical protein|nr:hypothetical protein [Bryobacteraceae bacterium]